MKPPINHGVDQVSHPSVQRVSFVRVDALAAGTVGDNNNTAQNKILKK